MKPSRYFVMLSLLLSVYAFAGPEEDAMCPGNSVVLGESGLFVTSDDVFRGSTPLFAIVNQNYRVKAIDSRDLCPIAYTGGNNILSAFTQCLEYQLGLKEADYSFGRFTFPSLPNLADAIASAVATGHDDNTIIITNTRRIEYISAAYSIDGFTGAVCDATRIYWQAAPTLRLVSSTVQTVGSDPIEIEVAGTYDTTFSKVAVNGQPPTYRWTLNNLDYGGTETVTTSNPHLIYHPRYTGDYSVSASISDGTYSAGVRVGRIYYSGGSRPSCPANEACRQIR